MTKRSSTDMANQPNFAVTHPLLAAQLVSPAPEAVTADSQEMGRWHCSTCRTDWFSPIRNRTRNDVRCRRCRPRQGRFKATEPGYLYVELITLADLSPSNPDSHVALKVGATQNVEARRATIVSGLSKGLHAHSVARYRGSGEQVQMWERAILDWFRDTLGAPTALPASVMRNGWTETISLNHVTMSDLLRKIEGLTGLETPEVYLPEFVWEPESEAHPHS